MIIVAGHLRVAPGDRQSYLDAVADVAVQARRSSGCHDFVQSADPIEADRINIYERWDDDESLEAFRASGGEDDDPAAVPDVVDADVAMYRISSVENP